LRTLIWLMEKGSNILKSKLKVKQHTLYYIYYVNSQLIYNVHVQLVIFPFMVVAVVLKSNQARLSVTLP
jgi:hypothetical protein